MANEDEDKIVLEVELDDGSSEKVFENIRKDGESSGKKVERSFSNSFKSLAKNAFSFRNILIGMGSLFAGGLIAKEMVEAASIQEDAINSMNTSLRLAGRFSEEASQDFQNFASELQRTTTIGDEATLELASLASNFARTNDEAKKMTEAAIELSAATGMELESALKNVGKTTAGMVGELGESIPALRELTAEQLKAGEAVDFILERFGGAAASKVNTFSGALKQASNLFGDLKETIGALITSSPTAIALLKGISSVLSSTIDNINEISNGKDPFKDLVMGALEFGEVLRVFVVRPLEYLGQTVNLVFTGITMSIQSFVQVFAGVAADMASFFAPESDLAKNLNTFNESSKAVLDDFVEDNKKAFDSFGSDNLSQSFQSVIDKTRAMVAAANEEMKDFGTDPDTGNTIGDSFVWDMQKSFDIVKQSFSDTFGFTQLTGEALVNRQKEVAKDFTKSMQSISKNFSTGFARSFSSIGAALVNGENAFEAFGKTILGVLGGVAIEMGTVYFLSGLASYNAGQAGLGLALIALGGALKALSSGAGGVPNTGGGDVPAGSVGAQPPSGFGPSSAPEIEESEPKTLVNVVFNGNNLQTKDSGRHIKELLQESFDSEGGFALA